ncbi:branched-chain amino acid ABC transporter permease [Bordetella hinzii]|uniref:Branched-chain amino acid ABC transporter permease n=1 Tax=Bordetella hinzii TaxID=103855 RepID=A0AAN1RW23_9BORD|nr:branched-chain amino acid ABC transporter permease [Bordetella hinzii]AKQ61838.1 leucine/isoleucine/valine transporter permease subunit [Bordetella hinzii]AZW17226.1 branched-chain amino acid ABC transporter permease [Bordetella hinzii]KCB45237.1 branched-chain amino acid ABC transporter, permease protein [Bordetella hinzii 4161]MBZ0074753.1 branched-chain amino acid ABC transporter permease [Bordetella hinzii]MBZ0079587.1 branched-chain amino acid ABC transporter permease [Bordetella hinzi
MSHPSTQRFARQGLPLLCLLALAAFAFVGGDYYTGLALKIMIYSIFALGLQLLVGSAGLVSLGQAAFFGLGAYAAALLSPAGSAASLWWLLPAALAAAGLYALATGALALRTKGVYFIMVTLAFSQMAYYVMHDTKLGGGSDGIYLYFRPEPAIGGWLPFDLGEARSFYFFVLGCLAAAWIFLALLRRSPFGAALTGIGINEQRMRAAGYASYPYKLAAYVIAAVLAGLAGFLYALKDGFVTPELLAWEQSALVLLMVILGGQSRQGGAVLGAAALLLLQEVFQSREIFGGFADHWHLPLGLAIIALVAWLPQGLIGLAGQFRRKPADGKTAGDTLPVSGDSHA